MKRTYQPSRRHRSKVHGGRFLPAAVPRAARFCLPDLAAASGRRKCILAHSETGVHAGRMANSPRSLFIAPREGKP